MISGRRDRLAEAARRAGVLRLMELLPGRPRLLVFNYHRIGRAQNCPLDRQVYSTDADGLDEQIRIIRRMSDLLHPAEAVELLARGLPLKRTVSLLTFDDGYLDNHSAALPVLEANGAIALFFLVSGFLEAPHQVTWWDKIAFLARQCVGRRIGLSEPRREWQVGEHNVEAVVGELLAIYRTGLIDEARFMDELEASAGRGLDTAPQRMFMSWEEARDLVARGMVVGVHSHSHPILSRLDEAGQREELALCKSRLEQRLATRCDALAYPVGARCAFNQTSKQVARELGFRCAFSYDGGANEPGAFDLFDVKRVAFPSYASAARSRTVASMLRLSGKAWF